MSPPKANVHLLFWFQRDLAAIEAVEGPHKMDIVSVDNIRTLPVKCIALKQSQFKHAKIPVPEDLRSYFKRPESYADFAATVKSVFVEYDEENGNLLLSVSPVLYVLF